MRSLGWSWDAGGLGQAECGRSKLSSGRVSKNCSPRVVESSPPAKQASNRNTLCYCWARRIMHPSPSHASLTSFPLLSCASHLRCCSASLVSLLLSSLFPPLLFSFSPLSFSPLSCRLSFLSSPPLSFLLSPFSHLSFPLFSPFSSLHYSICYILAFVLRSPSSLLSLLSPPLSFQLSSPLVFVAIVPLPPPSHVSSACLLNEGTRRYKHCSASARLRRCHPDGQQARDSLRCHSTCCFCC